MVIDPERAADVVRHILTEQLGVDAAQLTPDADLVRDLGADAEDLFDLDEAIEQAFHLDQFDYLWNAFMETDESLPVGALLDAVIALIAAPAAALTGANSGRA